MNCRPFRFRLHLHRDLERILGLSPGTELKGVYPALLSWKRWRKARECPRENVRYHAVERRHDSRARHCAAARKLPSSTARHKDMPAIEEETQAAKDEGAQFVFLAAPHRAIGDKAGM